MLRRTFRILSLPIFWLAASSLAGPSAAEVELLATDSVWRYLDDGSDQGTAWRSSGFDDSAWKLGEAPLGYGFDAPYTTELEWGSDPDNKYITSYFRQAFSVPEPTIHKRLKLTIRRDDGAIVYLNGQEIYRGNMAPGPVDFQTLAFNAGDDEEFQFVTRAIDPTLLVTGENLVAIELHLRSGTQKHKSVELSLTAGDWDDTPSAIRGPYLQRPTEDGITLRWRTDYLSHSVVRYGTSPGVMTHQYSVPGSRDDHALRLSGLEPDETYYYAVGTYNDDLAGGSSQYRFHTPPPVGARRPYRIWVVGDSGTPGSPVNAVLDAYQFHTNFAPTNVWLLLGDNAYPDGTDDQYNVSFFSTFPELLRNTVPWPVLGNHDQHAADPNTQQGPYFDIFELPTAGECGGVASQTESNYSFDYGNIHFVALRSSQSWPTSAQREWLEQDLAANDQDWTIVFQHLVPYSKGSHDSDEGNNAVRVDLVPVFDAYGVDLVLSGHSHSYERSYPLRGHVGKSDTLEPSMMLDTGDGDPDGDGIYLKAGHGPVPNRGVVYAVLGSSASLSPAPLDHPAMVSSHLDYGSLILDVEGERLEAKFVNRGGKLLDHFVIQKGVSPVPALAQSRVALAILLSLICATAGWRLRGSRPA